jgi:hypothetical protein
MTDTNQTVQEYFKDFPEAPASDTFKWVDQLGNEHMTTLRAWSPEGLSQAIRNFVNREFEQGAKSLSDYQRGLLPKQPEVQQYDETGTPIVDAEGKPVTAPLPQGVHLFTVAGLFHDKNKDGTKDILKVLTVEPPYNKGYGVSCFHPNGANGAKVEGWKAWPVGKDSRYAPPAGFGHVLIRDPQGDSKYPDIVEFQA